MAQISRKACPSRSLALPAALNDTALYSWLTCCVRLEHSQQQLRHALGVEGPQNSEPLLIEMRRTMDLITDPSDVRQQS
jgi:hypothetical protein